LIPGKHVIALRDDASGLETKLLLRLAKSAGGAPAVVLNLDTRPWAEVTIDGKAAGTVPIANRSLSLGRTHRLELVREGAVRESLRLRIERAAAEPAE